MIIKDQSSKIWGETPYDIEEAILWIERAGRVCYRSEDKIVEGSGEVFVNNIIKRKHFSVIEHSNLVIRTKEKSKFPTMQLQVQKSVFDSKYFNFAISGDRTYISGNWRAWIEWMSAIVGKSLDIHNVIDELESTTHELVTDPNEVPVDLKCITVEYDTDRAVTHELVRHRPACYSQESQRYVRYGEVSFIKPAWYDNASLYQRSIFDDICKTVEIQYKSLLSDGMKAEDARVILPNATATKIIMTASIPELAHVDKLRTSNAAYPQIRKLLKPVMDDIRKGKY